MNYLYEMFWSYLHTAYIMVILILIYNNNLTEMEEIVLLEYLTNFLSLSH